MIAKEVRAMTFTCQVAIGVEHFWGSEDEYTKWFERDFYFLVVPRVGEIIWLSDSIDLLVSAVEHGFVDDGPPVIRLVTRMVAERFHRHREFLESWGFTSS